MSAIAVEKNEQTAVAPVQAAPVANPVMEMIKQAVAAGQPLDVIRELKALSTELANEEAQRAFDRAIAAAKAEIKPIARRTKGHNGNYADLATVADAIDPILSAHGLNYRHRLSQGEAGITVTCILSHELGHREETSLTADADKSGNKNSIQAIGSTQTYLMRYTLLAALGLSTTKDDDGATAARGAATISEEQALNLNDLITAVVDEIGGNRPKFVANFLKFMKVERIEDIPAAQLQKAVNAINSTRGAK